MVGELMNYYQFMFPINRLIEIYNRNKNSFQGTIIDPLTANKGSWSATDFGNRK